MVNVDIRRGILVPAVGGRYARLQYQARQNTSRCVQRPTDSHAIR
jgi:hypothetical protein